MFSPADGGFCGARSCYSDLRLPAALYIENFTIFYHIMQAESYFLFFQKSPPIRNYRQVLDHFVSSPLPLLRCCSVFFLLFFSGFTNNASPMFVIYFVGGSLLHLGNERYVFYLLLLVSSFLGSFCTWLLLRRNPANTHFLPKSDKESTNSLSLFDQFDLELNHSAELLIKIGCYILVFSVLTSFLKQTVFFGPLPTSLLCGILEITTGNHLLCQSLADSPIKTALSLAITSFGGLCAMAQTNSVIQKNGLSIFWYAGSKLFSGFFAFFLCLLWLLC